MQKMNSQPFSVLMSVYAKERPEYLAACFDSLYAQTLPADEIVLVLDGPVGENLQQVVRQYRERLPLKIVPLPENVGLGKALNQGLQHCRHEWVLRMDTDDICVPNRFALQMSFIGEHADISLVGGQIAEFEHNPQAGGSTLRRVPTGYGEICRYAVRRNPFNHMAVAYRKSAVAAVGGYCHHLGMEDYNLWLRMLSAGYLADNLPEILVWARAGRAMHSRRRGMRYVHSEWRLACLKYRLGFQTAWQAGGYFLLRGGSRLLPTAVLGVLYRCLRRRKPNLKR